MQGAVAVPIVEVPHVVRPPAQRARRIALLLSFIALVFSLGCGVAARRSYALFKLVGDPSMLAKNPAQMPDELALWFAAFLVLLLIALLFRGGAAICELWWLERTWTNLPERLRQVGPVKEVSAGLAIAVSFIPGIAWVWKLGLIVAIANGFEAIRKEMPFAGTIPKTIGKAAVIAGWVPGLNVYLAPFLWEIFARRIDVCVNEILAAEAAAEAEGAKPSS